MSPSELQTRQKSLEKVTPVIARVNTSLELEADSASEYFSRLQRIVPVNDGTRLIHFSVSSEDVHSAIRKIEKFAPHKATQIRATLSLCSSRNISLGEIERAQSARAILQSIHSTQLFRPRIVIFGRTTLLSRVRVA